MNWRRFLSFAAALFIASQASAGINYSYWSSAPSNVNSGVPYYIEATTEFTPWNYWDYSGTVDLSRDGNYVTSASGDWSVAVGETFTDTGSQVISYEASSYDYYGNYDWTSCGVEIVQTNAPVPTVTVDGYSAGVTITRPRNGSVTITVRFKATDPDGNLAYIRPLIWKPSGELDNNSGIFITQSGSSGEVVRTVTLNANGNWRFWAEAQDAPLAASGGTVNSGSYNSGFLIVVNEDSGPPPSATVTIDGYSHGSNVIWYEGCPAPTVIVRYKATDSDANLTGIRPQVWTEWLETVSGYDSEGYWYEYTNTQSFFDNNGGQFVTPQSSSSGEVVRTWTLDHDSNWYFWSDAIDSSNQFVNSGAWTDAYRLTVVRQPSYPTLVVQYLDGFGNVLSSLGDGNIHLPVGESLRIRLIATAPGNNISRIYWRMNKPGSIQGTTPNSQWGWGGGSWMGQTDVSGNTTWTSAPFIVDVLGNWNFWHHAQTNTAWVWGSMSPWDGNSYGWATVDQPDVLVVNTPPSNDFSAPAQTYVGQSFTVTHTANNPTSSSSYEIGFSLYERREDVNGVAYQDWTSINRVDLTPGNRSYSATRPAPDRPGVIRYQARSWHRWMGESDNVREFTVQVPNRSPSSVSISPGTNQTLYYGQSITFSSTASDPDNNLTNHNWDYANPNGLWNGQGATGGSPGPGSASGGSNSRTGTLTPHSATSGTIIGSWQVRFAASDNAGASWIYSSQLVVNVAKTTPEGTFNNKTLAEGIALSGAHLNATFRNTYNTGLNVPAAITYTIVSGGWGAFPNGRVLQNGLLMAAGTYTVRASSADSSFYNAATVDATFTVTANGTADNDGDGLSNDLEQRLGTDPNSATPNNSLIPTKVHSPRQ